jgi:murein DD-endopeptidase MepM/ murein hydrolase activator NlpD
MHLLKTLVNLNSAIHYMIKKRINYWIKIIATIIFLLIGVALLFSFYSTSVTKNIDTYIYSLPFREGTKHRIVQGYGGLFSHKNIAAVDFEMPEGTPIYAAREGVVYTYKDQFIEGGPFFKYKNKSNFIIIKHTDESFGCYWHLKKDGVVAKKGKVALGQLIGYSGATGFTLRPHLHFSVKRKLNYEKESFVQTKFLTSDGLKILKNGCSYERPIY